MCFCANFYFIFCFVAETLSYKNNSINSLIFSIICLLFKILLSTVNREGIFKKINLLFG